MPTRLAVLALVLLITACARPGAGQATTPQPTASESPPTPTPTIPLQTSEPAKASPTLHIDQPPDGMSITGTLGLDAIEGGCTYLQADDKTRYEVIYPSGWQLRLSPLELRSPNGALVAVGGDTITVRGARATDRASICQIGPIFEASEVIPIDQ